MLEIIIKPLLFNLRSIVFEKERSLFMLEEREHALFIMEPERERRSIFLQGARARAPLLFAWSASVTGYDFGNYRQRRGEEYFP